MMVVGYGEVMFIIDAGLMFPEDYMLGVRIVIPAMDYLRENADEIEGIILTHAHEDKNEIPSDGQCLRCPFSVPGPHFR